MSSLPPTYVGGFHDEKSVLLMKYNTLGNTGLKISQLSMGGGVFSSIYGNFEESEAILTVRAAIQQGINYIDTAPWYGQGKSEEVYGMALKDIPRSAYYIATKVGRYERDFENMFDFSAKKTRSSVEDSLKRLALDYVDIIQVHDIEFSPSLSVVVNETLPTLIALKKEGKVRHIGLTGYPLSILKDAIILCEEFAMPLNTVLSYSRYTLIDTSLQDYMQFFQLKGLGVICAADHAMGLLTGKGPQPWHPASTHLKSKCNDAAAYCENKNIEMGRLALWYSLQLEGAATHLIGINNRPLLHSNLSVLNDGLTQVEADTLTEIQEKYFKEIRNSNWEGVEVDSYNAYMKNKINKAV